MNDDACPQENNLLCDCDSAEGELRSRHLCDKCLPRLRRRPAEGPACLVRVNDFACPHERHPSLDERFVNYRFACFDATSQGNWQTCLYGGCRRTKRCTGGPRGTFRKTGKPICSRPLQNLPPHLRPDDGLDPFNPEGFSLEARGGVMTPKEKRRETIMNLKTGKKRKGSARKGRSKKRKW